MKKLILIFVIFFQSSLVFAMEGDPKRFVTIKPCELELGIQCANCDRMQVQNKKLIEMLEQLLNKEKTVDQMKREDLQETLKQLEKAIAEDTAG